MTEEERDRLLSLGVEGVTEIKFENSINRITGISNPRQIERVIKGALFPLEIIYELTDEEEALEDIKNLKEAFDLLENDYIGGNGSRGYGRVKFINMNLSQLTYDCSEELLDKLKEMWFHE
ncbi:MAG: type III-A CRISPR-associated RAMP protein Csm3 [Peptoniphilaceae bacterium]